MNINHQIRSLQFELTIPFKDTGFEIQERLNTLCQENILKILEESLNQIDQPDVLTRINRLELDLGIINLESFEADICEKLAENLDDYLAKIQHYSAELNTNISQTSLAINPLKQLSYFLKTGQLPWNAKPETFQDFDALILHLLDKNPDALKQLWQQTLNQTNARQRLIFNLEESTLERLIINSTGWTEENWQNLKQLIYYLSHQLTQVTVISAEKLWRWDNLIQMLSLSQPVEIQVFLEKWLEKLVGLISPVLLEKIQRHSEKLNTNSAQISLEINLLQQLAYFFKTGKLPSNAETEMFQDFDALILHLLDTNSDALKQLWQQTLNQANARQRLIFNLQESTLDRLLITSMQWTENSWQNLKKVISFLSHQLTQVNVSSGDKLWRWDNLSPKQRENRSQGIPKSSPSSSSNLNTPSNQNKQQVFPETFPFKNEKAYFISNSGLVLLWPYLPRYLEALNYVQNNQFISPHHQLQAIHPLEHLVRGKEDYREYDLVLNKVLLSLPLSTPINPELGKTCFQPQEVNQLLESAIRYWTILGNTSVDGFRQSFLKREGKLIAEENNWKLIVNRKGYDILLEKLPYPLYCLKLPWMKQPLYVEW